MKLSNKILIALGGGLLAFAVSSTASAQVISTSEVGVSNNTAVELTLTGNVVSALELEISTRNTTSFDATASNTMPTRATATIDFGTFSTLTPTLTNGTGVRTTTGTAGAHAVADLRALVRANGVTTARIGIERLAAFNAAAAAPRDIAAANLKYSTAAPTWLDSAHGTAVPAPGASAALCATLATCTAGVDHQLAVFVADSQGADSFSTVVLYTGTGS